jgi:hypothetical protein
MRGLMTKKTKGDDDMRSHYDFSGGVRGKYAGRYVKGMKVSALAPEADETTFPDSVSANEPRRALVRVSSTSARAGAASKKRVR